MDNAMSDGNKICVLCNKSCAGMARIKNSKGQYAHKECAQAKKKHEQAQEQEPMALDDGMGDLLDDLDQDNILGGVNSCPGCGQAMDESTVICMSCGFNRDSGQQFKTKASKDSVQSESKVAAAGSALVGGVANHLLFPIIGGCIGGAVGAGIWAAVAFYGQIQLGILAWGIGVLVGVGVNIGSRDTGGAFFGIIAAFIAIIAVVAGNYTTASLLVSQYLETLDMEDVTAEMAKGQVVVHHVIDEWLERGDEIPWPKEWKAWDLAEWPDDYSMVIQNATDEKWEAMSYEEQDTIRAGIAQVTKANSQLIEHEMIEYGFIAIMMRPLNILWLLLAIGSAFSAASYQ